MGAGHSHRKICGCRASHSGHHFPERESIDIAMTEHDNERLVFAALAGDLKLVEERIKFADNINFQYRHKGTALHQAAMGNKTEIALVLIQAGADVNVLSREGSLTPLDCASERHGGAP